MRFQRITWAVDTRWGLLVLKWKDISNEYTLEKLENQIMSGSSIAVVFVHSTWSEYQLASSFICTSSSRVIEYKKSVKWQPPDDCRVCTWMIISHKDCCLSVFPFFYICWCFLENSIGQCLDNKPFIYLFNHTISLFF